jgi:site-specific recombinase
MAAPPQPAAVLDRFVGHEGDPLPLFVALVGTLRPRPIDDLDAARRNQEALCAALRESPERCAAVRTQLLRLLGSRREVSFYTDAGILPNLGFFSELERRITDRLLPEAPDTKSMRDCVRLIWHHPRDHVWLAGLDEQKLREFWALLDLDAAKDRRPLEKAVSEMLDAVLVLSHRISAMGLEPELLRVCPEIEAFASPFLAQSEEAHAFVESHRRAMEGDVAPPTDHKHLLVLIEQCRDILRRARKVAAKEGTSLGLTYLLYRAWQSLERLERLLSVLADHLGSASDAAAFADWTHFFRAAVRGENERNSVRRHVSRMLSLLALRVTDNAGRTGEHYITTDWPSYGEMWRSAMGAGFIIAFLALIKIYASKLDLAPLNQAFVYSMNYGLGFMLIHVLHFTIATKQPAMTAATIAATIGDAEAKRQGVGPLVDLIVDVLRSQFAAILGNVLVAIPTAFAIAYGLTALTGKPFLDAGKAYHLLHDLSPTHSLAIPHAAIAGVCLFLSGLISGYFDNRAVYARIPQRVAALPWLNRLFGARRAARWGDFLGANLGGLAGNFFFGIMLGSMGTLGLLLGLPLDIRHIAFASANYAYALVALDFALPWQEMAWAAVGVALIGVTNLGVSFALALWVALKARGIAFRQTGMLLRELVRRFVAAPMRFFVPPRPLVEAGR